MLGGLRYRGDSLTEQHVESWVSQVASAIQPTVFSLLWHIGSQYFINEQQYFGALSKLAGDSGIPSRAVVHFCGWQHLGQSAPRVMNELKNLAGWRADEQINLDLPQHLWPDTVAGPLIVTDDMVGSGGTLMRLVSQKAPLYKLLRRYPQARVYLLFVIAYEQPLKEMRARVRSFGDRVRIITARLLTDSDRCFTNSSEIIRDDAGRAQFRAYCQQLATERMKRLPLHFHLGYADTGSLIVFANGVPNNTLPMFWYEGPEWAPLFPAEGLIRSMAPRG